MKKFGKFGLVIVFLAVILLSSLFVKRVEGFASAPSTATKTGIGHNTACEGWQTVIKYGNKDLPIVYCLSEGDYANTTNFFPYVDPKFGTPICDITVPGDFKITAWEGTDFSSNKTIDNKKGSFLNQQCRDKIKSIRITPPPPPKKKDRVGCQENSECQSGFCARQWMKCATRDPNTGRVYYNY